MYKKAKKALAVIFCLAIILTALPVVSFAEEIKINNQKLEVQTDGDYKYVVFTENSLTDADKEAGLTAGGAYITSYINTMPSISIPTTLGGKPVQVIGNGAFKGNTAIQTVTVNNTVKYINSEAFMNCTGLQQVLVANSAVEIRASAFKGCTAMKTISFQKGSLLKTIGSEAFYNCTSLNNLSIPAGVETIEDRAFYNCDSLISIEIPDSVTSLGVAIFFNCDSLRDAVIGNGITELKNGGWISQNWGSTTDASGTFEGCISLTSVTIGSAVKTIGQDCFAGTSLINVTIPDNVITVSAGAFKNCGKLEKITVGNGVTSLGNSIFENDDSLADVKIGSSVDSIGDKAFYDCDGLEYISIPSNVTSLGKAAFFHCDKLKTVITGNGITELKSSGWTSENWGSTTDASGTFEGCISLTSVTIGSAIKTIGQDCFAGTSLPDVYIPDNVITVSAGVFKNCSKLEKITVGNGVTSLGNSIFENDDLLTDVKIGSGVVSIGDKAFYDCDGLEYISIPSNVTSLGKAAFFHCDKLKTVIIGNGITEFRSSGWTSENWGSTRDASGTFEGCTNLTTITIGSGIITIGQDTFAGTKVTSLTIPSKVSTLNNGAFAGANELKDIYFVGNWAATVGNSIFKDIADGYTVHYTSNAVGYDDLTYNTAKFTPITVTFDDNDEDVFCAPTETQFISPEGGYVIEPISPTALGYIFAGWYKDSKCTQAWDFKTDKVSADITLYAKWNSVDSVVPVRPENISTANKDGNSITLRWAAVDGASSYNIYKDGSKVNTSDITTTTYTVKGLQSSTTYEFEVAAVNSKGESEKSLIFAERTTDHVHAFDEWVITKEANCSSDGEKTRTCSDCGETETEKIPATGAHDFGEWIVTTEATCTRNGVKTRTCSQCKNSETETISATGIHSFGDWTVITPATTDSEGLRERVCVSCGEKQSETIEKLSDVQYMLGDLNGDGKITASDARTALRISAKLETPTEIQFLAADVDKNGKVTASDARTILRVSAKLETF